jgi:hypothetical protein
MQTTPSFQRFLAAFSEGLPSAERIIFCGFRGDPNAQNASAWKPRPWRPGQVFPLDPPDNAYVTVASFGRTADGTFRRRRESFAAGRALLVDDVGTKVKREIVADVPPTAIVETSPGNFQYWYFLREPERNAELFDGLIRAFISGKLLGNDPGMSGVTRVGRLPGFTNGKPQYRGFRTILQEFEPSYRYTPAMLLEAFDLKIEGRRYDKPLPPHSVLRKRVEAFCSAEEFLRLHGMLKRRGPDLSGWQEIVCPWKDEHTGAVDNGAAIRQPADENQWYGAFRCHHSHGIEKTWSELTQWIDDLAVEELEKANAL